jgi:PIN domain nuclease of toxin-antitoxin system
LSGVGQTAIADAGNTVFVSAATAWEVATKFRLGKLPGVAPIVANLAGVLDDQGFISLPISFAHGQLAGTLPGPLRDPFDRMLIAQAMLERMALVSNEASFNAYGIRRVW